MTYVNSQPGQKHPSVDFPTTHAKANMEFGPAACDCVCGCVSANELEWRKGLGN